MFIFNHRIGCIPCRTCYIGDDGTIFSSNAIHQRGLSNIRLPDDGNMNGIFIQILRILRRKQLIDTIQQISGSMSMHRRNGIRIAQPQIIELVNFHRGISQLIALVDGKYNGFSALQQQIGNSAVVCGYAAVHICYQNNYVCTFDGKFRLPPHLRQDFITGIRLNTAGIHHHEGTAPPFTLCINTIPCDTRGILHNGKPLSDQLIKQRRLSHIWAAYHCNNWQCHGQFPPFPPKNQTKKGEAKPSASPPRGCMVCLFSIHL